MPTIYNTANIQAWEAEAKLLTASKPAHQAIIAQQKEALEPFKRELHSVQGSIRRLRNELRPYEVRQTLTSAHLAHRILHPHHRHHHHHHVHHRAGLLRMLSDGISAYQLERLSSQLRNLERNERRILDDMRPYESKQASSARAIAEADSRLNMLAKQVKSATAFLTTLKSNPQELLNHLSLLISRTLKHYDERHPETLSPQVSICLISLTARLAYLNEKPEHAPRNYLYLCALLQDMRAKVIAEGLNPSFAVQLNYLIDNTHIDSDLPDELQTNMSLSAHYKDLEQQNPGLFSIMAEQLPLLEQQRYNEELERLQKRNPLNNALENKINDTLKVLSAEVEAKQQKNEAINYRFYNHALNTLGKISNNPQDIEALSQLAALTDTASGAANASKQVAGLFLAILGISLIIASVTCLSLTFGLSSFASGFGAALGLSLLQSQVTLGLGASLTILGGQGLMFWGFNKLSEGSRQGLSKELEEVTEEVNKLGM